MNLYRRKLLQLAAYGGSSFLLASIYSAFGLSSKAEAILMPEPEPGIPGSALTLRKISNEAIVEELWKRVPTTSLGETVKKGYFPSARYMEEFIGQDLPKSRSLSE